jgi:CheY-like chemotaxis protein
MLMTRHSILIVDNEANQRLILEQTLRALPADWSIATAASGSEALGIAALHPPDLIITDYHMPFMNGLEFITHIRGRHIAARIILITAYSSPELNAAAERLAVDYYLAKPVRLALLRNLAAAALATIPICHIDTEDRR